MRQKNRSLWKPAVWMVACAAMLPLTAAAETFTVTLDNGNTLTSRYQPKLSMPDETKIMFLTDTGNWIALPRERVTGVESSTESRGFGRVINTTTIALGFAPNERAVAAAEAAMDPTTQLLRYLSERDAAGGQDFSVQQFVNTEGAGQGGFPSSSTFGGGSSSGPPGNYMPPGTPLIVPRTPPPVVSSDGVQ